jgi:tetratricopeptide (TPR) repeat protein
MKCSKCNYEIAEDETRCPKCRAIIPATKKPSTTIEVTQKIGKVKGGTVKGVQIGKVKGKLTIRSTVNQIEKKIVKGDYVDRQMITNNIMVLGPQALDEIVNRIAAMQGVDKQTLQNLGTQTVPENVSRQIAEIGAAQRDIVAKGLPVSAQASYQLGMLAAYDRKYQEALDYFRQATQIDPDYSDAYEAIAWMQQYRAMDDIDALDYKAATEKLDDARSAAMHTDPLDPNALSQRGYVAKTLAQVSEALKDQETSRKYYEEALKLFQHVLQLEPNNAGGHNGLGNIEHALGNIDAAIAAYQRAIDLLPNYAAAHHDLALAFEDKMNDEPTRRDNWCKKAIQEWQRTYELAPQDPGFSADNILKIGRRITWLKQQGGKVMRKR